jgi:hypothetical protein
LIRFTKFPTVLLSPPLSPTCSSSSIRTFSITEHS